MQTNTKNTLQTDRVDKLLRKLAGLSPEKMDLALTMCSFFIDGMNAQERLVAERPGA